MGSATQYALDLSAVASLSVAMLIMARQAVVSLRGWRALAREESPDECLVTLAKIHARADATFLLVLSFLLFVVLWDVNVGSGLVLIERLFVASRAAIAVLVSYVSMSNARDVKVCAKC